MRGSCVLLGVCFLSVYGHVEAMSLVDLVLQSAAKLNSEMSQPTNLQDSSKNTLDSELANKQHVKQRLEPIVPSAVSNNLQKSLQTDSVQVPESGKQPSGNKPMETAMQLQQQKVLHSSTNGVQQTAPVQSEASIKEAAELVLQYIQLTPKFTSLHNIQMPRETSKDQQTPGNAHALGKQSSKKTSSDLKASAAQRRRPMDEIQQIRSSSSDPEVTIHEAIKLLMEVAPNMTEKSIPQTQVVNTDLTCRGPCPPKWIKIVNFFSHLLSPGSEMCHIHQVMQLERCELPNTSCKPGYTCCSSSCLPEIVVCDPWYPHSVPDHICLPEDVSGWWPDVQDKFIHIASHAAKHGHKTVNTTRTSP